MNAKSGLLKDGSLSFTINVLPAPTDNLSMETKFLLSVRHKWYFYLCLTRSNIKLMKEYINAGCDINCVSDFFSPTQNAYLHDATGLIIATNDHCNEAVQLLLDGGCDIQMTNANGDNALLR